MITPAQVVKALRRYPPVRWERWVNRMTTEQRQQYADGFETLAIQAAWMTGYLEARHGSGCGGQGHIASMQHSNVVRGKVRKAFGYDTTHSVTF